MKIRVHVMAYSQEAFIEVADSDWNGMSDDERNELVQNVAMDLVDFGYDILPETEKL